MVTLTGTAAIIALLATIGCGVIAGAVVFDVFISEPLQRIADRIANGEHEK